MELPQNNELPSFSCACGTEVTGLDRGQTLEVIKDHICSAVEQEPSRRDPWYSWVFSMWGWAIVATIGFIVLMSLHPELWDK